jgi:hypothetical protein
LGLALEGLTYSLATVAGVYGTRLRVHRDYDISSTNGVKGMSGKPRKIELELVDILLRMVDNIRINKLSKQYERHTKEYGN